jgi:hypothetical protein
VSDSMRVDKRELPAVLSIVLDSAGAAPLHTRVGSRRSEHQEYAQAIDFGAFPYRSDGAIWSGNALGDFYQGFHPCLRRKAEVSPKCGRGVPALDKTGCRH